MVAKSHFHRLSKGLDRFRDNGFLTDCTITTDQGPVNLHKIVLFAFSTYQHEIFKSSTTDGKWNICGKGLEKTNVENLVKFLYNSDVTLGSKVMEIIKLLKLDLSVNIGMKKKKLPPGESVQSLINMELKYLRNLTFEMKIPHYLQSCIHTDIVIKAGTHLYKCHRVILSACSKYFEVMFASGMKESSDEVINLQGVSSEIFSLILSYMYTGNLVVTIANAQDLLSTSVYLQAEALQTLCEDFLLHHIDTENCTDMWLLGKEYNCLLLAEGTWSYLVDHFSKVPKLKLLKRLKQKDLKLLLNDDNLNVSNEKEVLLFMLQWLSSHKKPELLDNLIDVVRFHLVDITYLKDLIQNNVDIRQNNKAVQLITDALSRDENSPQTQKPRKEKVFVVIKRSSYTSGIEVAAYSLVQKAWYSLSSFTNCAGGTGFSTCSADDSLFVTGGTATPKEVFQFSVTENKWFNLPEMLEGRSSHSSGYVNHAVYVLGGSDVSSGTFNILSSIEKYNPVEKIWIKVGDLEIPTYDSAHAVLKTRIYIFGGSMGLTSGVYIKDIQCFDTVTNTCTIVYHNLPFLLSLAMACSHNKDIYITCPNGKLVHYNEEDMPKVVSENQRLQLMGFACLYHEQAVYIMGGYSMTGESDIVHRVDLKAKKTQLKHTQIRLPFKKQSNQLFASVMHVSRKFLTDEHVVESPRQLKKPTCTSSR